MRFIIYGAGAVGGVIGGKLQLAGNEVVLIARGKHLAALQSSGLTLNAPAGSETIPVTAVGTPAEIQFRDGDVVFLAMKTQDSVDAIDLLRDAAGPAVPVICIQNGVENERMALRRFHDVYAMVVMLPATHLEPGVVQADSGPIHGILDAGRYPRGVDERIREVCRALEAASFSARPEADAMRWKYAKLLMNLNNAFQVICGIEADGREVHARAREEAIACYQKAGIEFTPDAEYAARRGNFIRVRPVPGGRRMGASSWQSIERGTGSVEVDYLNGEIALLGRLHGVPTPVNDLLQELANTIARTGLKPGEITPTEFRRRLGWDS